MSYTYYIIMYKCLFISEKIEIWKDIGEPYNNIILEQYNGKDNI